MKIRIYYEDTDMGGVVYHTNYIKYCERARSEIFFQNSLSPNIDDCHFVVKELNCNFKSFAILGDLLEIKTDILELKGASITLIQKIYKDNIEIFNMSIKLVFLCNNGKINKIPKEIRDFFLSII